MTLRWLALCVATVGGAVACQGLGLPSPVLPSELAPAFAPAPSPTFGPAPVPASATEAAPEEGAEEILDNWSLVAREDGEACREALKAEGFRFRALGDKERPDKSGCGIPHPVLVMKGPTGISYDPPVTVDCSLARALANVERIVQEEAETHLQGKIARIGNLGGYACRPRNTSRGRGGSLSAHAFGSALDVSAFHPAKGTPAIIARDYAEGARTTPAREARRAFLHAVFARLRREADLTYAIGPEFNAQHRDHFHLDRGGWHFWAEGGRR